MNKKTKKRIAALKQKLQLCRMRLSGMKRQPGPDDDPEAVKREMAAIEKELAELREA